MFPSELATGLCSLNPHVDRLVQSCVMEIDARGTVVRYELHDGVIHSDARMTYTDVNAILTDHDPDVTARYALARADVRADARAVRRSSTAPPPARVDRLRPQGAGDRARRRRAWSKRSSPPSGISPTGSSRSSCSSPTRPSRSISTSATIPTLYRIHEEPDPIKVEQFEEFISTLGYSLSRSGRGGQAARFPEAGRADARHARGEADRVPHAADDAEGALRRRRTWVTSGWRRRATPTSRRRSAAIRTSSSTARCASRGTAR